MGGAVPGCPHRPPGRELGAPRLRLHLSRRGGRHDDRPAGALGPAARAGHARPAAVARRHAGDREDPPRPPPACPDCARAGPGPRRPRAAHGPAGAVGPRPPGHDARRVGGHPLDPGPRAGSGPRPAPAEAAAALRGLASGAHRSGDGGRGDRLPARVVAGQPGRPRGVRGVVPGAGRGHAAHRVPTLDLAPVAGPPAFLRARGGAARGARLRSPWCCMRTGTRARPFAAGQFAWLKIGSSSVRLRGASVHDRLDRATTPRRKEFTIKALGDFSEIVAGLQARSPRLPRRPLRPVHRRGPGRRRASCSSPAASG